MSRDKQIEELAEIISSSACIAVPCPDCEFTGKPGCLMRHKASAIYNAGYRKVVEQSETARECREGVDNGFSSSVTESVTRADVALEVLVELEAKITRMKPHKVYNDKSRGDSPKSEREHAMWDVIDMIHEIAEKYTESEDTK